jgi:hypothetical protein
VAAIFCENPSETGQQAEARAPHYICVQEFSVSLSLVRKQLRPQNDAIIISARAQLRPKKFFVYPRQRYNGAAARGRQRTGGPSASGAKLATAPHGGPVYIRGWSVIRHCHLFFYRDSPYRREGGGRMTEGPRLSRPDGSAHRAQRAPGRKSESHSHTALCILYGYSRTKHTGTSQNDPIVPGVNAKGILIPPCVFCTDTRERSTQGRARMALIRPGLAGPAGAGPVFRKRPRA